MPELVKAALLGLVQGLTEFLPVSSSAHLVFAREALSMAEPGIIWGVCLHLATALATLVVLRREVGALILGFCRGLALALRSGSLSAAMTQQPPFQQALLLALASVPVALAGYFLKDALDALFEDVFVAGACLGITGSLLWTTRARARTRAKKGDSPLFLDRRAASASEGARVGWKSASLMGLVQAVALLPGISRSGSTISAGILCGAKADEAARFSFLMAVPAILGAAVLKLSEYAAAPGFSPRMDGVLALAVGFLVAGASGYFALRWLLRVIARGRLSAFAWYCWAAAAGMILWKLLCAAK